MVPKLHAKGKSFRGCATYLLHDKGRASTSERVEWTETRNLATEDPEVAWRVMAATSMDQGRLKTQAGIKNTGRKSKDHVLHLTLSWHPDEAEGLSRKEMLRAANGALHALDAGNRQVLFVSHNDEPQPHLHIMINRVSPEDGRMLSSSQEKLKLSEWAEGYEKERGQVYCEERVINNAARKRGEYTRGEKDQARNIYEQQAGNDNLSQEAKAQQRRKDAELAKCSRDLQERHAAKLQMLKDGHKARIAKISADTKAALFQEIKAIREAYRKPWTEQSREHDAQMTQFEKREETLFGKVQNAYKALDIPARVGRKAEGKEAAAVSSLFDVLSSSGARKEALKAQQERDKRELTKQQRQDEVTAARRHGLKRAEELKKNRAQFAAGRSEYLLSKAMDLAKMRAEWRHRTQERKEVFSGDGRAAAPEKKAAPQVSVEKAAALARAAQRLAAYKSVNQGKGRSSDKDEGQEY